MQTITVYVVFLDMEDDVPDAYCMSEVVAKQLKGTSQYADYIEIEVTVETWLEC